MKEVNVGLKKGKKRKKEGIKPTFTSFPSSKACSKSQHTK